MEKKSTEELISLLVKYKKAYYTGHPLVSDAEYDRLEEKLKSIDPDNPVLKIVGSESSGKVFHDPPMLSADKATNIDKVISWAGAKPITWGYKVDGLSLEVDYIDEEIFNASTRGDGKKGDDVTEQARNITNLPKKIDWKGVLRVRGEAYMPLSAFRSKVTKGEYSSPRNLAAGTILAKDPSLTAKRGLRFMAWDVLIPEKRMHVGENIKLLQKLGFETADQAVISAGDIESIFSDTLEQRECFDFEMDGLVFKMNDPAVQASMGSTDHHPRWMIALKFPSKEESTVVEGITWQVGRTGKVTPVAEVKPIKIEGALISRATLHNVRFLKERGIAIGDKVFIIRSGGVIPKILGVAESMGGKVDVPDKCPTCRQPLHDDGVSLWCKNVNCPARNVKNIEYFIETVKIMQLGGQSIERLVENGLLKHASDLYKISEKTLHSLLGENGTKIYTEIQSKKKLPLHVFLASLGIPSMSSGNAKKIAETFLKLENITPDAIKEKMDTNLVITKNLIKAFSDDSMYKPFLDAGVVILPHGGITVQGDAFVQGKKIYITGSVEGMTKEGLKALVESKGGIWASMSKSMDLLVVAEGAGAAKIEKAKEWGIKMMLVEEFFEKIGKKDFPILKTKKKTQKKLTL